MSPDMSYNLSCSFAQVVEALQDVRDDWWLIGGAAFSAHGVQTATLKDIDVLLSFADAKRIAKRFDLHATSVGGTDLFRSRALFQWMTPPIPVEFMAELEVKTDEKWHPVLPKTREAKTLAGVQVFVPSAGELMDVARLFGRPKDLKRGKDLAQVEQLKNLLQTTS